MNGQKTEWNFSEICQIIGELKLKILEQQKMATEQQKVITRQTEVINNLMGKLGENKESKQS